LREHDRARELLGPYLLGELSAEEEAELRGHLEGCAACRAELVELRQAHESLKAAYVPPPPELKRRVMGRLSRPRRRRSVLLVAASLALVTLLGSAVFSGGTFLEILAPGEYAAASLEPTGLAPGAGGEARLRESGENVRVRLEVWGLPEQRSGEFYEVWFVRGEDRVSAGSFTVGPGGKAEVDASVPARLAREFPAIGITAETAPGDPRPSGDKVLGAELEGSQAGLPRIVAANT